MHFDLKPISEDSIPEALAKVERYRLLNEPSLAESICLDILTISPDHQQALISLLLARTEQFSTRLAAEAAHDVLARIKNDYERCYYGGIIWERLAHAQLRHGRPGGRLPLAAGSHESLRESRGHPPAGQRRRDSALEHLRPGNHAELRGASA